MSYDGSPAEQSFDDGIAPPQSTVASGKYAIVVIGVLAVSMASAAIWYQYRLQHRPLEYWGSGTATLLLSAPQVEALLLAPMEQPAGTEAPTAGNAAETINADERTWRIVARREISRAPGFSHVRRSLMMGGSYDWSAPEPATPVDWHYALVFRGAAPYGEETIVLFTADGSRLSECSPLTKDRSGHSVSVGPVAGALKSFLAEQFPAAGSSATEKPSAAEAAPE